MKITVTNESGKKLRLKFPTGLVLNGASAAAVSALLREKGLPLSQKQLMLLFHAAKAYKATHPKWTLVEATDADGSRVEIVI